MEFDAIKHSLIYAYRGSIAHNLNVKDENSTDDIDLMGVCIAPIDYYLGLKRFDQFEQLPTPEDANDIVVYDILKYFRLLLKANPNLISLLWNHPSMYISITPLGKKIIDNRDLFSSQLSFNSFFGYAYSQLKKMTKGAYRGYMGAKRKALVKEYGYDIKNASHFVRLLRMGTEFLNTGEFIVYREKDRKFLLDIKQGKYTFEQIERIAKDEFKQIKEAKEHTKLPKNPDYHKINDLLQEIMLEHFYLTKSNQIEIGFNK